MEFKKCLRLNHQGYRESYVDGRLWYEVAGEYREYINYCTSVLVYVIPCILYAAILSERNRLNSLEARLVLIQSHFKPGVSLEYEILDSLTKIVSLIDNKIHSLISLIEILIAIKTLFQKGYNKSQIARL